MARCNYVKAARKAIYKRGTRVEYESLKGKRKGMMLTRIDKTIPDPEGDEVLIHKGQPYYWWAFMNGPKYYSLERPKPSQLTQSDYLQTLYRIQEEIEEADGTLTSKEEFEDFKEDIKSRLEELRDEQEEKRSNMPEHLQDVGSGELLQERFDALDSAIDEIENIDLEDRDEEEYPDDEEGDEAYQALIDEAFSELSNIDLE